MLHEQVLHALLNLRLGFGDALQQLLGDGLPDEVHFQGLWEGGEHDRRWPGSRAGNAKGQIPNA